MSRLSIYKDDTPGVPVQQTEDVRAITGLLATVGVDFERWDSPVAIGPEDSADAILEAYRPHLDMLMGKSGAGSADVIKLRPGQEGAAELRTKLLSEHRHTEPEVRFFVQGSASFILHIKDHVYDVRCTQGDLIGVPAGVPHWFDAGEQPSFTVLRVFTDAAGWVAQYTGNTISARFPAS